MPTLTRVRTAAWTTAHVDDLHVACQDEEIRAVLPLRTAYTRDVAHDFVTSVAPGFRERGGANMALVDQDERLAGCVSLSRLTPGTGRVGYWVAATHRGQGVATQAVGLISIWARHKGYSTLELTISECNTGSRRVAERAGFEIVERLPEHRYGNGDRLPSLRYHKHVN